MLPNLIQSLLWFMKETVTFSIVLSILKISKRAKNTIDKIVTISKTDWNHALDTMIATAELVKSRIPSKFGSVKLEKYCIKFLKNQGIYTFPTEWQSAILALFLTQKLDFLIRVGVAVLLIIPDVHKDI